KSLTNLLKNAQKDAQKGKNLQAKIKLNALKSLLSSLRNNGVHETAYQVLIHNINTLISSL
ncbi:MAG: hypothetical protein HY428_02590, partial [Candidatus Levybacteria bacterium]|nr:hypothetical protein [Candidatus Levybacteria bacterium]